MAQSGGNAADKNFCPAGAPPARPPGAGGTFPIAPHARSRPWGSFGESAREAAFKSKCATQVLNLRRGPSRAKKMEFRLRLKITGVHQFGFVCKPSSRTTFRNHQAEPRNQKEELGGNARGGRSKPDWFMMSIMIRGRLLPPAHAVREQLVR